VASELHQSEVGVEFEQLGMIEVTGLQGLPFAPNRRVEVHVALLLGRGEREARPPCCIQSL
jgi:hypothetical protein